MAEEKKDDKEKKKPWYVRFGIWFDKNLPYIMKLIKSIKEILPH